MPAAKIRQFTVSLTIGRTEFERLYRGQASNVLARDVHGRTVSFPARSLRPFLDHGGVRGTFVVEVDADNRLLGVRRRGD